MRVIRTKKGLLGAIVVFALAAAAAVTAIAFGAPTIPAGSTPPPAHYGPNCAGCHTITPVTPPVDPGVQPPANPPASGVEADDESTEVEAPDSDAHESTEVEASDSDAHESTEVEASDSDAHESTEAEQAHEAGPEDDAGNASAEDHGTGTASGNEDRGSIGPSASSDHDD